jgi:hypothetical protein
MKKILLLIVLIIGTGLYLFNSKSDTLVVENKSEEARETTTEFIDYKNATYQIDGQAITFTNGVSEILVAPDSATKVVTRYFGNEHVVDLNNDGVEDIAFVVTQETVGSGTFFYAVGAVKTETGYLGTDGFLLGDRISPQSTDDSPNPKHKNVVVFNYQDRAEGEPMTTNPSVGKSTYLKLVPETMQWAVVEADFEGESR